MTPKRVDLKPVSRSKGDNPGPVARAWSGGRRGHSGRTEPLPCGIWCYLQCLRITWCWGVKHTKLVFVPLQLGFSRIVPGTRIVPPLLTSSKAGDTNLTVSIPYHQRKSTYKWLGLESSKSQVLSMWLSLALSSQKTGKNKSQVLPHLHEPQIISLSSSVLHGNYVSTWLGYSPLLLNQTLHYMLLWRHFD